MSFVERCPLFGVSFSEVLQRIPYSGIFSLVQDFAESLLGPSEMGPFHFRAHTVNHTRISDLARESCGCWLSLS